MEKALQTKLQDAPSANFELDHLVAEATLSHLANARRAPGGVGWIAGDDMAVLPPPAYTASVDAAIGLAEKVFPGWRIIVTKQPDGSGAATVLDRIRSYQGYGANPALAICAALVTAKVGEAAAERDLNVNADTSPEARRGMA